MYPSFRQFQICTPENVLPSVLREYQLIQKFHDIVSCAIAFAHCYSLSVCLFITYIADCSGPHNMLYGTIKFKKVERNEYKLYVNSANNRSEDFHGKVKVKGTTATCMYTLATT